MDQKKSNYNPKSSLSIRVIAGAYLLYTVFMLIKGYGDLSDKDKIFNMLFIVFFAVTGVLLLFTSIRSWIRIGKEEKDAENQEHIQEDDRDDLEKSEESEELEKSEESEKSK